MYLTFKNTKAIALHHFILLLIPVCLRQQIMFINIGKNDLLLIEFQICPMLFSIYKLSLHNIKILVMIYKDNLLYFMKRKPNLFKGLKIQYFNSYATFLWYFYIFQEFFIVEQKNVKKLSIERRQVFNHTYLDQTGHPISFEQFSMAKRLHKNLEYF